MDLAAPGGVNAPAETSTAEVTTVFGMISLVRLEHVGAAVTTAGMREQAAHRNNLVKEVITFDDDDTRLGLNRASPMRYRVVTTSTNSCASR